MMRTLILKHTTSTGIPCRHHHYGELTMSSPCHVRVRCSPDYHPSVDKSEKGFAPWLLGSRYQFLRNRFVGKKCYLSKVSFIVFSSGYSNPETRDTATVTFFPRHHLRPTVCLLLYFISPEIDIDRGSMLPFPAHPHTKSRPLNPCQKMNETSFHFVLIYGIPYYSITHLRVDSRPHPVAPSKRGPPSAALPHTGPHSMGFAAT